MIDSLSIEITVNRIGGPHNGAEWSYGPKRESLYLSPHNLVCLHLHGKNLPSQGVSVEMKNLVPVLDDWAAGQMRLTDQNGTILGNDRPFMLYTGGSDVPSYTMFPPLHPELGAFSVGLRCPYGPMIRPELKADPK